MYYVLQTVRLLLAWFVVTFCTLSVEVAAQGRVMVPTYFNVLLVAYVCWRLGFVLRRFSRSYADWSPRASGWVHVTLGLMFAALHVYLEIQEGWRNEGVVFLKSAPAVVAQ